MSRCLNGRRGGCWEGLKENKEAVIGNWRKIDFLLHSDE